MSYRATVIIEKDEDGYYAYVPELDGCQTQGDSLDEVMANIEEAMQLYLETMTQSEIRTALSKSVFATTLEVEVA